MREASPMKDLINQITVLAVENNARRITRVRVWLGARNHMTQDNLREHFNRHTSGSIAEHAKLDIFLSDDANDPNAKMLLLTGIDIVADDNPQ